MPLHRLKRMRRARVFVAVSALTGALLVALAASWTLNRDDRWVQFASPASERAIEIVALNRDLRPFVRTEQGNLYFCSGASWRDTCRQVTESELPASEVHPKWLACAASFPQTPPIPGSVVDSVEVGWCAEASTFAKTVLLGDGTLWQWRRTFSWVRPFSVWTGGFLGLALGSVIASVVVFLRRYLRTPVQASVS